MFKLYVYKKNAHLVAMNKLKGEVAMGVLYFLFACPPPSLNNGPISK